MKNLIFALSFVLFLASCTENPPIIPPLGDGGGGGVEGERKVLVEEFTGVRCTNCPDGSAEIQNLLGVYGERMISVSIHAGFFSNPLPESKYDFRTDGANAITTLYGEPSSNPAAIINRKEFGGGDIFLSKQSWAGHIQSELDIAPKFNIELSSDYSSDTRSLTVTVKTIPLEDVNEKISISIMLSENDIEDAQDFPTGVKEDYIHKHVFRRFLTSPGSGETLGENFIEEESVERTYTITIPEDWKEDDCNIIAFVHQSGPDYYVYQAEEIEMK